MLKSEIKSDGHMLRQVKIFIDQLRTPFGFLSREIDAKLQELKTQDKIEEEAEKQPDHKYFEQEQKAAQVVDQYIAQVAQRYNYNTETIPWLTVTKFVVWIFLVLVMLQMMKRNCFLSLTVATCALYVLEYPQNISR